MKRITFMKRIAFWTVLTLCGSGSWSQAAPIVEGFGSITTNLPFPFTQIDTAYEGSVFLDVANSVQLPFSQIGPGSKLLEFRGQAQFGRLGARSFIGGHVPSSPNLSTGVDIGMGFVDQITAQNLNPLTANFLRLDVELSGNMNGAGGTNGGNSIGKLTAATFGIQMVSLGDSEIFTSVADVQFSWFGDNFFITNTDDPNNGTQGFVPYPGEEPSFTPGPPLSGFAFGTSGYVDIPLDLLGLFGPSFLLDVSLGASSSCGNENPTCSAITDFGSTALIGNARIVDGLGNVIPGATFASASTYDYITPPGPLGNQIPEPPGTRVPEPETSAMLLLGVGLLGFMARRRQHTAAP